jgi:NAD(P)-dependent dehydrogenase (short-subunit alcohol dehydrogenase family)
VGEHEIRGHRQLRQFTSRNPSWPAARHARTEMVARTVVGGRADLRPPGVIGNLLYLESAPYVTGEILPIDGGRTAGH